MINNTRSHERRDDSQIKPRFFLLLEFIALGITSYIFFVTMNSLGIAPMPITIILIGANCYLCPRLFFKCQMIANRSKFRFEKSFY